MQFKRWIAVSVSLLASAGCGSGGSASPSPGPQDSGTASTDTGTIVADGGADTSTIDTGTPADSAAPLDAPSFDAPADSGQSAGDASGDGEAGDAGTGSVGPYGADGPSTVTTAAFMVPSTNGTFTTTAYIPSGAGPFPVVILSSGFFQDGVAYAPYAQRLASWGILTFLRDDPNLAEGTPAVAADVSYTVATWLSATNADASSMLHGKIAAGKVGLAGHSRGGQIALLAAEGGAKGLIQGVFGLDPVDTSMSGDPEARTTIATIGVPLAFIGETTDSAASGCAPAADDFLVLYQAAASPAVAITAVNADHTMFEDPASCSFCTLCTAGTASQPLVLATAVRYLTAFFARQLLGDASVGAAFAGAGASQDVTAGTVQVMAK